MPYQSDIENTEEQLNIEKKVANDVLQECFALYAKTTAMTAYVKIPFALIAVLILLHNLFLAGRSFDYSTYNTITTIEFSIGGCIALSIIIIAIIAMSCNLKLKKILTEISQKHHIDIYTVQEEFNLLAISMYGGSGFIFKAKK